MRTPLTAVVSCCAYMLMAFAAVLLLWSLASTSYFSIGIVLLSAALVSFATWVGMRLGLLLARRRQTATGNLAGVLLAGASVIFAGVLLGAAFGVSLSARAQPPVSYWLLVAALAAISLLSALAATLRSRRYVSSSIAAVACCVLGGLAFGLGFGLQRAASYRPCPPHRYCLDPGSWYGLQVSLPGGAIVGLAVGLLVWLAFSLDLAISSLLRRPPTTASA